MLVKKMAKRMKLDEIGNTPEVEKLQQLNDDMSKTLKLKQKDTKFQKYEELLAEYRQVLDDFVKVQSRKLNIDKDDIKDKIESILQKEGVTFKDKKVYFPLDHNTRKQKRKAFGVYSRDSYEEAVRFLSSKKAEVPTHATKLMARRLAPYLKNVVQYPNLSVFTNDNMARFSGKWSRL